MVRKMYFSLNRSKLQVKLHVLPLHCGMVRPFGKRDCISGGTLLRRYKKVWVRVRWLNKGKEKI